ncbi:Arginine decarboxylase 1A, chloroplastic [Linum perenne]
MQVLDIGGSIGIDYDGSKSSDLDISVAYGLRDYALAIVQAVKFVCDMKSIKHPILCSESGRAIVSQHSVLIFEAVSSSVSKSASLSPLGLQYFVGGLADEARSDYRNLAAVAIGGEYDTFLLYAE